MRRPFHLLLALAAIALAGWAFSLHQAGNPALGGAMSGPAAIWLIYALASLFLIPAAFAGDSAIAPALRRLYAWHLAFWGARAALELPLMYLWHAWRPMYGILHDMLAIALLGGLAWRAWPAIAEAPGAANSAARGHLAVLAIAIACECAFAWLFNQATGGQTATWWFPDDTPRFERLNHLTAAACALLVPLSAVVLTRYWGSGAFGREDP